MAANTKADIPFLDDGQALDPEVVWKLYNAGEDFNDKIKLSEKVKVNENMFIGMQWNGVNANGLPTPVFNFIKRTIMFKVATITSDNLKVNVAPMNAAANRDAMIDPVRIVSEQFDALMEQNRIVRMNREFCRDAAVRGDGCLYTYWDAEAPSGAMLGKTAIKGRICTEILQNTRVYFGDPNERSVQKQPYIIIKSYIPVREMKRMAKKVGAAGWEDIAADQEDDAIDDAKKTDDKVTDLLVLWRDADSGEIWSYECTAKCQIKEATSLGIKLYPIVWLNWDYIQDCYHGQAEVTGLVPNQLAYNRVWAASIMSILTLAFPRVIYDPTRIKKWSNQIGAAIKCIGGDMSNATKNIDPATISPQVYQYMGGLVEQTEKCMGVTAVAMGDTRPDNTSAIIALQRAASTPMELTKLNDIEALEDLFRIYLEFITVNYGKRDVDTKTPEKVDEAVAFAAQNHPELEKSETITTTFDFSTLRDMVLNLRLDVGASSYFSEISAVTTLGEWMKIGAITPLQCAERLPAGYMPKLDSLIRELKEKEQEQKDAMAMASAPLPQPAAQAAGAQEGGEQTAETLPVVPGKGFNALARAVTEEGAAG